MSFRESKKRKKQLYKKILYYFLEESNFLSKGTLEVVGLRKIKCKHVDYYCRNDFCFEYIEVISEEGDIEGKIVQRMRDEGSLKSGKGLGTYHVIKNGRGKTRFVKSTIEGDPLLSVVNNARKNFFFQIILQYMSVITLLVLVAFAVHYS